jgi:uncharacterized protein YutE (UPF0331/DUF86 family)
MTDIGLVLHKLQRLKEQIALVRARRPTAPEVLSADLVLRDAMALALMVALQEVIDIAYHIVADEGWGVPDSHRAAFELLATRGVLDVELASRVASAASLRNRIAHGYASVEHERIWRELPEGLEALDAFVAAIAAWLPPPDPQ